MVALKRQDIDAYLSRPDPARPIALVYGPDAGLVRERVEAIARASVDDLNDPFAFVHVEGDALSDEPSRLVEEAHTVPLFGGRRAVWVKAGGRNMVPAVEALIAAPPASDCRVVIEAGDLKRNAPLRTLCEKAKPVAVIPCYADSDRDLAALVDLECREAGLTIAPDARTMLVSLIGGDRAASRSELRKLALYAHGKGRIETDDVIAVVADASALALDGVVDAAFAGRPAEVETQFAKARGAGTLPSVVIGAVLRHATQLHRARATIEAGTPAGEAYGGFSPPVHFRREAAVKAALSVWSAARLERAMQQLAGAVLETRQHPTLAEAIAQRALLSIAASARRKE